MGSKTKAVVIHGKDNVAIALEPLRPGLIVSVEVGSRVEKIQILSDIPMGHKFALIDMDKGEAVIKYGEPIGQSTAKISRGEHVHVHNVASQPR
jgi:altronate dehydratase small subunit